MTLRCVLYVRYSSDQQRAASIEDQFRVCRERAAHEGWKIAGAYKDSTISGDSMILRPGIQAPLEEAPAGDVRDPGCRGARPAALRSDRRGDDFQAPGIRERSETVMPSSLHCPSCGRTPGGGPNGVSIATIDGEHWCGRCARVHQTESGRLWVHRPSPGRMMEQVPVALDAWMDCYEMKPKIRITVRQAEQEIQRAWARWMVTRLTLRP